MDFRLSNAMWALRAGGLAVASRPATMPAATETPGALGSLLLIAVIVTGLAVLLPWIVRTLRRPGRLTLADSPPRPNTLTFVHVLAPVAAMLGAGALALVALAGTLGPGSPELHAAAAVVQQVAVIAASLVAAALGFPHGLARGLGLTVRRLPADLARGTVAVLGVLPVCVGLVLASRWAIEAILVNHPDLLERILQKHEMLQVLRQLSWPWRATVIVSAVLLASLSEEMLFRGLLQSALRRVTRDAWAGVIAASLLFALIHYPYVYSMPALFALGLVLGYSYERAGRLWPAITIHLLFNAVFVSVELLSSL